MVGQDLGPPRSLLCRPSAAACAETDSDGKGLAVDYGRNERQGWDFQAF